MDIIDRGAMPYERTFGEDEIKETSNKELKELRERMSGLKIYETFEPNREYARSSFGIAVDWMYRNQDYAGEDICNGFPS